MPDNSGDTSPEGQPSNCEGAQGADAKAPRLRRLRISDISVGNRLLDINEGNVRALMDSISDVGLIQPIAVSYYGRDRGGRSSYGVNVGAHRLEAHKRLGLKEIDAVIIDFPGRKGMLAEIDENLIRRDLTDAERAKLTAERKRIYELDHPETKHGGDRKGSTRQNGDVKRFTEDTAEKTGRSERSVQRDAARGEALSPDVLDKVKGTVLDKGTELDALARLPEDEQRALAERAKAGEQVSAKVAKVEETQAPIETDVPVAAATDALSTIADSDEEIGTYLEALGPDRFFSVLDNHAPKIKNSLTLTNAALIVAVIANVDDEGLKAALAKWAEDKTPKERALKALNLIVPLVGGARGGLELLVRTYESDVEDVVGHIQFGGKART
jgi:ParB-like chromosome segregation protein Spo0J